MIQVLNLNIQVDSVINKNRENVVGGKYKEFYFGYTGLQRFRERLGVDV